jgi:hypothetical protein
MGPNLNRYDTNNNRPPCQRVQQEIVATYGWLADTVHMSTYVHMRCLPEQSFCFCAYGRIDSHSLEVDQLISSCWWKSYWPAQGAKCVRIEIDRADTRLVLGTESARQRRSAAYDTMEEPTPGPYVTGSRGPAWSAGRRGWRWRRCAPTRPTCARPRPSSPVS